MYLSNLLRTVALGSLLLVLPAASPLLAQPASRNPTPSSKPRVVVSRVVEREVNSGIRVVGSVKPIKSSTIGSAVAGRVIGIDIELGAQIEARGTLAQLMTDTLKLEQAAAEAELELARQQANELKNGARPEEIAEAEAIALGAKSAMENSASSLRRLKSLASTGAATAADLDTANERATMARYAYEAAQAIKKRVTDGPRIEQIAQAEARVNLQEHNVQLIKDRIAKHTIITPFKGFVAAKFTELGAWVNAGDPIAEVIALDVVEVVAPVTSEHAANLRVGSDVRVEFSEFPGEVWTGTVHRIVPVADARSRTYPVIVRLENEFLADEDNELADEKTWSPKLKSGMLARVELPTGRKVNKPLVHKDALVLNDLTRTVYVVDVTSESNGVPLTGKVRRVPVELGVADGGQIQVDGELKDGDFVVVLGNERLPADVEVDVIEVRELEAVLQGAAL